MEGSLIKEKGTDKFAVWAKELEINSDNILNKIFPEKYLQSQFGDFMAEIIQYSRNPDLPEWIRGIAAQKVQIIMNVFENYLAIYLSDFEAELKSRLRLRMIEIIVDYLNLSIGNWLEVANWKFVILSNGSKTEIAFIRDDEIIKIKRR